MHFIFPSDPLRSNAPGEFVSDQVAIFRARGHGISLISVEALLDGKARIINPPTNAAQVVYRGWMLRQGDYQLMSDAVAACGATMLIDTKTYLSTHHLPNWYSTISDLTAETIVVSSSDVSVGLLKALGWEGFFIKDFVKSLKTSCGSKITDLDQLPKVLSEMTHFRGGIEGGICLRRLEDFVADSEVRYFVRNGVAFGPTEGLAIPQIVSEVARRFQSPFYSVDIAKRTDAVLRVVEVGDGQVSDLVGWPPERFADIWNAPELAAGT